MSLITLANVKANLGLTSSAEDVSLGNFIRYADCAIKNYCARDLELTVYPGAALDGVGDSGIYCGDDTRYLVARQYPVLSVQHVYYDPSGYFGQNPVGAFAPATELTLGTDFALHIDGCLPGTTTPCSYRGTIERLNGIWPALRQWKVGAITPTLTPTQGNIGVQYTAGFTTVPADLESAAFQLVVDFRRNKLFGSGRVQNESYENYSVALAQARLATAPEIGSIRGMLSKYRRISL